MDKAMTPKINGKDFYKLFHNLLGDGIKNYPLLNPKTLNNDDTLYVALISFSSGLIGMLRDQLKNNESVKSDIKNCQKFQISEPMRALKNDTYGTGFEDSSRKYCFDWIKQMIKK